MDEERLREVESWLREDREDLTLSEIVLLDALSEACVEIRRSWETEASSALQLELCRDELRKDRLVMEGADLELALSEEDAPEKARAILGERLEEHGSLVDKAAVSEPPQLLTDP